MDYVTEHDLTRIFREAAALSEPQEDPRRSADCLPLPRFRVLALDPTRWTVHEWLHVHRSECRRCATAAESMRAMPLEHPSTPELLAVGSGVWGGSELTRRHLEVDRCRRCLAIVGATKGAWKVDLKGLLGSTAALGEVAYLSIRRLPWLPLVGAIAGAFLSPQRDRRPRRLLVPRDSLALGVPGGAQAFADDEEHDLHVQFAVGEHGEAQGTLEERDGRDLVLTLETREPAFAGLEVSFAVVGSEGELVKQGRFKMSKPGFEGWIVGSSRLGAGNLRKKLGASPSVLFLL